MYILQQNRGEREKIALQKSLFSFHTGLIREFLFFYYFFFLATPCGLWDLSSLTRDGTWATAVKAPNPNHWTAREIPGNFPLKTWISGNTCLSSHVEPISWCWVTSAPTEQPCPLQFSTVSTVPYWPHSPFPFIYKKKKKSLWWFFCFVFLALLGLRCWAWAFSSCGEQRLLFVAVCRLLISGFSLQSRGL